MNEHLSRFFEHADALLAEWQAFGANLRAQLDEQARALQATMTQAVDQAGREAASALDAHLDAAMRASLDKLRGEIDSLSESARGAGEHRARPRADTRDPARNVSVHHDPPHRQRSWHSGAVLLGLTLANVILAALLVTSIRSCTGEIYEHQSGSGWGTPITHPRDVGAGGATNPATMDGRARSDASAPHDRDGGAGAAPSTGPTAAELCATLGQGYDAQAARAFAGAAAIAMCPGEQSALDVTTTLLSALPDAIDAPDAEKKGEDAGKKPASKGESSKDRRDKKDGKSSKDRQKESTR